MKRQTSVYLDTELYQIIKLRKLNISQLVEELLRQYLERKENRNLDVVKKELNDLTNSYLLNKTVIELEINKLESKSEEIKQKEIDASQEHLLRTKANMSDGKFTQFIIDRDKKRAAVNTKKNGKK